MTTYGRREESAEQSTIKILQEQMERMTADFDKICRENSELRAQLLRLSGDRSVQFRIRLEFILSDVSWWQLWMVIDVILCVLRLSHSFIYEIDLHVSTAQGEKISTF